jgi:hypothetical protein
VSSQDYTSRVMVAMAKQVATYNGQIWDRLDERTRRELMTLANSLYATVERLESQER